LSKAPRNVIEELWKLFREKTINFVDNVESSNDTNGNEDEIEFSTASNPKGRKNKWKKGPMDMFQRNLVLVLEKRKKEEQRQVINIKKACEKFEGITSSIYGSFLVPTKLVIQSR